MNIYPYKVGVMSLLIAVIATVAMVIVGHASTCEIIPYNKENLTE